VPLAMLVLESEIRCRLSVLQRIGGETGPSHRQDKQKYRDIYSTHGIQLRFQ